MSTPSRSAAAHIVRMPTSPPSDIDVARALGHQHAAGRRLVLRQLGPVVRHGLAPAVGQRVALGQQLGGRRGALVDRADLRVLPLAQPERRARPGRTAAGARAARCSAGSPPRGPRSRPRASARCSAPSTRTPPSWRCRRARAPSRAGSPRRPASARTAPRAARRLRRRPPRRPPSRRTHRADRRRGFAFDHSSSSHGAATPSRLSITRPSSAVASSATSFARHATCASGRTSTQPDSSTSRARAQSS